MYNCKNIITHKNIIGMFEQFIISIFLNAKYSESSQFLNETCDYMLNNTSKSKIQCSTKLNCHNGLERCNINYVQ